MQPQEFACNREVMELQTVTSIYVTGFAKRDPDDVNACCLT